MQWYYEGSNGQVGPVSEEEFQALIKEGIITYSTLVWNSTMTDWEEYGSVDASSEKSGSSNSAICAECGRSFSRDDMIKYGDSWVCAQCKPIFVQKIKEGVNITQMDYAGFWIRFGAYIIDSIIMTVINLILSFFISLVGFSAISQDDPSKAIMVSALTSLINMIIYLGYETYFIGKWGATIGKMACGLKVVTPEGEKVTYLRAFGRYFAKIISSLILCIGFIMAGFDDEKRALHDRICSTRVISK
ncbi:MAG: RDD family protein [Desulfobacteraceae bacterium]|jgi:uncharacterized RDD family membrane protein YckC